MICCGVEHLFVTSGVAINAEGVQAAETVPRSIRLRQERALERPGSPSRSATRPRRSSRGGSRRAWSRTT